MTSTATQLPTATTLPAPAAPCPAWCTDGQHGDGQPCFGGMVTVDLTLSEPLVSAAGDALDGPGWMDICLWQSGDTPVIGLAGHNEEIADLTLAEAEALAHGLLQLVQRAKAVAPAAA